MFLMHLQTFNRNSFTEKSKISPTNKNGLFFEPLRVSNDNNNNPRSEE